MDPRKNQNTQRHEDSRARVAAQGVESPAADDPAPRTGMLRLTVDPQSRERPVTACEQERRRLRRDLHDGLGAVLGAIVLQLGRGQNPA